MTTELKPLPNGCTKKELKYMFPNENHRDLMNFVQEIHSYRKKGRYKRTITVEELTEIIMEYTGLPSGYSDTFQDGEHYLEKYRKIEHRLKIIRKTR